MACGGDCGCGGKCGGGKRQPTPTAFQMRPAGGRRVPSRIVAMPSWYRHGVGRRFAHGARSAGLPQSMIDQAVAAADMGPEHFMATISDMLKGQRGQESAPKMAAVALVPLAGWAIGWGAGLGAAGLACLAFSVTSQNLCQMRCCDQCVENGIDPWCAQTWLCCNYECPGSGNVGRGGGGRRAETPSPGGGGPVLT